MESHNSNRFSEQQQEFARVYDAHVERIYRFFAYRTQQRESAEDLTSQTFLKAFEHFSRFDPAKASAQTWLYAIARNVLVDHWRADRKTAELDSAGQIASSEDLEHTVHTKQSLERVAKALDMLTPAQREIVLLRLWDELSYAEIAAVVGKSDAACKMTFARGLSSLRDHAGPLAVAILIFTKFVA